jgi:hypothetical protein
MERWKVFADMQNFQWQDRALSQSKSLPETTCRYGTGNQLQATRRLTALQFPI